MVTDAPARVHGSSDALPLGAGCDDAWVDELDIVAGVLGTDPVHGLDASTAVARLRAAGRNVLPTSSPPSLTALIAGQLRETMIVVLLCAAVLTAVIGDLSDTAVIAVVVTVNTALGVSQQRRAERAITALTSLTPRTARVVRGGDVALVDAEEIVPGDLIELEAGDLVAADGRLVEQQGLEVDEAVLTGESVAAQKDTRACSPSTPVADRTGMVHSGTLVTRGRGRAIVTSTGDRTQIGRLARLLVTTSAPATPLQRRLAGFGRQIAVVTVALCGVVLVIGVARGEDLTTMTLTAISLAVAAVPESLPAVVTVSLALAAQRMARRSAVVRTLPAVESLGAVTVVCSDKTGTLTQGTMFATGFWTPSGWVAADGLGYQPAGELRGDATAIEAGGPLLRAVTLCNDARLVLQDEAWVVAGDPMEGALVALAEKGGYAAGDVRSEFPRVREYGFDHQRGRMTTVHERAGGFIVLCKGAPELVLDLVDSDAETVGAARSQIARLTGDGLRVLAVAAAERSELPADIADAERHLRLLGLVALHDPPRSGAAAAVAAVRSAGVVPIMITGDHPHTAAAIARRLGLLHDGHRVAVGSDIAAGLSVEDLRDIRVYARTAPEQKLAIVDALRAVGHVVAMTGDGVNDAPALRRADIGVAMGSTGTDVARQAADLVLVDDNIGTIVAAVEEGRRVYDNVRRFLLYGMAGGFAEVLVMLLGPAVGLALPLLPAQILWVNMLTHGMPGVALGAEVGEDDALSRPPRDPSQGVLGDGLLRRILLLGSLVGVVSLAVGVAMERSGHPWQSMVFVTLTLQQLGIALVLRSQQRSIFRVGLRGNPFLMLSLVLNAGLLWAAVAWEPLRELLGTRALSVGELGTCLVAAAFAPLVLDLSKAVGRRQGIATRAARDLRT
ncbi:MAG: cation-transporting P-type ATPase [Frankiaceae bacterium]|nr:cation-transporting P-type ATPase [Frankiaceae bacterium]